jgi:hypothetical protein
MHDQADASAYHLDEMDDASATNILALEELAGQIIARQSGDLDNVVERLQERGT